MSQLSSLPDPESLRPLTVDDFATFYQVVHGHPPFAWQRRLAARACHGDWPDYLKLPTSSGKTAAIDIAVFSLAFQACMANRPSGVITSARRIFFVVDRRIIVNEAYRTTRNMAQLLWDAIGINRPNTNPVLQHVADWLRILTNDPVAPPLDCHELRGGIYRDDAWVRSPLQPTVLTSTVDQVGSRMLFRGYGVSDRNQPIHAALTVCDSMIILDEAHCSRPFSQTVESIARYRSDRWAEEPLSTPFGLVQMTATPPDNLDGKSLFTLQSSDYDEDKLLEQRHACPKVTRLDCVVAAKGMSLVPKLAKKLVGEAIELTKDGCTKVAVVVNRVAIAREVHRLLTEKHGDRVRLMIGRMRPVDRDVLTTELQNKFGASKKVVFEQPQFVVATQCLEVGADLDFDGMVSQCASLDALRQRFGRLNRLGDAEFCHGVIVASGDDATEQDKLDDAKPIDSVYGNASVRTWHWLQKTAQSIEPHQVVDFGIRALDHVISESKISVDTLTAPSPDAPVLMPAHMDMLCQTSPRPAQEPDVSDLLHGPDRGLPEVRICWRADMNIGPASSKGQMQRRQSMWHETVAACPPSSAECLSVPKYLVKKWLAGESLTDLTSDVLGENRHDESPDRPDRNGQQQSGRYALLWKPVRRSAKKPAAAIQNDQASGSVVITATNSHRLRSGDTIVVPVEFGGWTELGHIPNAPRELGLERWIVQNVELSVEERQAMEAAIDVDVADQAFAQSRARTILRIHPKLRPHDLTREAYGKLVAQAKDPESILRLSIFQEILKTAEPSDNVSEFESTTASDRWQGKRIERLVTPGGQLARYPGGIAWTTQLHPDRSRGLPPLSLASFGDEGDSLSETGRLSLLQHLADVSAEAERLANSLPLTDFQRDAIVMSAKLHDLGKADPRFQALLLGQPVSVAHMQRQLWAKSDGLTASRQSELPIGFRHEMLTLELLDRFQFEDTVDSELVRHLSASHHGYARPLAPVVIDEALPGFHAKSIGVDQVTHEDRCSATPAYQMDSGVAERFWRFTRRFGWWGIAYLETTLRLADWHASAAPRQGNVEELDLPTTSSISTVGNVCPPTQQIVLAGIDGSRPLGFLAALGAFRTLGRFTQDAKVQFAWKLTLGAWRPVVHIDSETQWDESFFVEQLMNHLDIDTETHPALRINAPEIKRREYFQQVAAAASLVNRDDADWLSCNESDAAEASAISQLQTSRRDYHSIAIRGLLSGTEWGHLERTLFQAWDYSDPIAGVSLHVEPREDRRHAYQWYTPSGDPTRKSSGGMIGANRLALEAWPLFQSLPARTRDRLKTNAFKGTRVTDTKFTWPIWTTPIQLDMIGTLLSLRQTQSSEILTDDLLPQGISRAYRCQRILVGKTPNLTTAVAVLTD